MLRFYTNHQSGRDLTESGAHLQIKEIQTDLKEIIQVQTNI